MRPSTPSTARTRLTWSTFKRRPGASKEAAAAQAAHDALVGLFPAQAPVLGLQLLASLQGIPDGPAKTQGVQVGRAAAQILLAVRANDGASAVVTYTPGPNPGDWQPTPPAFGPPAFPQWPAVTPFALDSGSQLRSPPPPALTSAEYTSAFKEVKELGSLTSPTRTADQTEAALFWNGIVTPNAGSAENWNRISQTVAVARGNTLVENARLFALVNLAVADAVIGCWDAKYTYNYWRPVTAIRAADTDDNPDTEADPTWTPLMNTPSHPSYISGHSSVAGAGSVVLAAFFGTDAVPFNYSWSGLPGVTRSYAGFRVAAEEIAMSRIWAGFHWNFDNNAALALGRSVGAYVFRHFLRPVSAPGGGEGAPRPEPPPAAGTGTAGGLTADGQPGAAPGQAWLAPGLSFAALAAGNRLSAPKAGWLMEAPAGATAPAGQHDAAAKGDSARTDRLARESPCARGDGSDPSGPGKDRDLALSAPAFGEGLFDPAPGLTPSV